MRSLNRFGLAVAAALAAAAAQPAWGEVARIEVLTRSPVADGKAFGAAGPYEKLTGRLHYAVDPEHPANRRVVDLRYAPRDENGRVVFSGEFILLKPLDLRRGNRRLLYEVNNRGSLVMLSLFNDAVWTNDPESAAHLGTGFLLERGYSLLWTAWNWDVIAGGGRLQIELPVATDHGRTITGPVAAEIAVDRPGAVQPVAWGRSRGYQPYHPQDPSARLTIRDSPEDRRREIPRQRWRFVALPPGHGGPVRIHLEDGFRPGPLYELVYTAKDPRIVGLGLVAIRDGLSFFGHAATDGAGNPNPLAVERDGRSAPDPRAVIAFGFSQSGRVIQHMLWQGFHVDEAGRPVFGAALIAGAGGGKGSFNHRFAQTTRHPSQREDHLYPADFFPFATVPETDPVTGDDGSLLDRARAAGAVPFIFYASTATEYWTRSASLVHTDVAGTRDVPHDPRVRIYVVAGAQHGVTLSRDRGMFAYCGNPLDYRPVLRALLVALDRWATLGRAPPASVYPRIADGALGTVEAYRTNFPAPPGMRLPTRNLQPPRLDHGPRFKEQGIADAQPARRLAPYVTLVPLADDDGNDRGGIRLPSVAVPLGSYLGWNLPRPEFGGPDRLGRWRGGFLAFPADDEERRASADPRRSITARYGSRSHFVELTERAANSLVDRGFLLADEAPAIVLRAGRAYDALRHRAKDGACRTLVR